MKENACEQCEHYIFVIKEQRRQMIIKLVKYVSILLFVAVLSIAFSSYIPCIFLFLLAFL